MPLPPPYSGQEIITQMFLASPLPDRFNIVHLDTSHKGSNTARGKVNMRNIRYVLMNSFRLCYLLRRHNPELVYIPMAANRPGYIKFAIFLLISVWYGKKVASRIGGSHFDRFYKDETKPIKRFIRYTLGKLDLLIVRAEKLRHIYTPFLHENKIKRVYIGLPKNLFDDTLLQKLNPTWLNVLFVGYMSKAKGVLDILEAAPHITKEVPNVCFQFAGEILEKERNVKFVDHYDNIKDSINELISKGKLTDNIELLGTVHGQNKLSVYANSSVFVLPSYAEGFPFAVLEAMLAGKAVVTTPVGALPEVFRHGEHLFFVEPGDVKGIADTVTLLLQNPPLREQIGQNARKLVQRELNLNIFADRMESIFKQVLGGKI